MALSTFGDFRGAVVARVSTRGVFVGDCRPDTGAGMTRSARSYGTDQVS